MNLGALRSNIRVLFGSTDKVLGICSEERPELWTEEWILHHDNAPDHDTLKFPESLAKKSIIKMDHPPYSPDLAPAILGSFQNEKMPCRDKDLLTFLTSNATWLRGFPENDFQDCFLQWYHCIMECVTSQGEHFEGDSTHYCTGMQNFAFAGPFQELYCTTMYI
jgi:hypothetical protein